MPTPEFDLIATILRRVHEFTEDPAIKPHLTRDPAPDPARQELLDKVRKLGHELGVVEVRLGEARAQVLDREATNRKLRVEVEGLHRQVDNLRSQRDAATQFAERRVDPLTPAIPTTPRSTPMPEVTSPLFERVHALVKDVQFHHRQNYQLEVGEDDNGVFVQVLARRPDADTGDIALGRGGKRYLRADQSEGQIVRVIFGALLAYEEHEWREAFHYKGARVFGPHITMDALIEAARHVES